METRRADGCREGAGSPSRRRVGAYALVLTTLGWACTSELHCRDARDVEPGDRQCIGSGGAAEAVTTGVAAGAIWVAGGGCKVGGCHPTLVCNQSSGYCERPRCGEGSGRCPLGTECNSNTLRCE